jgi:beta-lactamase superfamily II metal-dependent hydrolase
MRTSILTCVLLAACGLIATPRVNAQTIRTPVIVENPVASKSVTISARGRPFRIWQLSTTENSQMMSYVIETGWNRKLIVIDGGGRYDARNLRRFIVSRAVDGAFSVTAWFVTHQHTDHIGALHELAMGVLLPSEVGMIYGAFLPVSTMQVSERERLHAAVAQQLNDVIEKKQIPHNTNLIPGSVIWIDGVKFEIFSGANPELNDPQEDNLVNDSSLVFRVSDSSRSILFTGDLGRLGARKLMAGPYKSRLTSDYVQMAHHGFFGASPEFYELVNARYCLWSTTESIYTNAGSGSVNAFTAARTRATVESETLCGPPSSGRHYLSFQLMRGTRPTYFTEIVSGIRK